MKGVVFAANNNNSSNSSTNGNDATSNGDAYLKSLNKNSVKIAKPGRKPPSASSTLQTPTGTTVPFPVEAMKLYPNHITNPNPTQQPPVYNINKSDFREVVQRLTGAPPNERMAAPPPAAASKTFSSRLQRIRPPPLAQIGNRSPVMNNSGFARAQNDFVSMLPPLPPVHQAAESPISAYMRILQSSGVGLSSGSVIGSCSGLGQTESLSSVHSAPIGPPAGSIAPRPKIRVNNQQNDHGLVEEPPAAAYMRVLQKSVYAPKTKAPPAPVQAPASAQVQAPKQQQSSTFSYVLPSSPLPFGCSSSQYGMQQQQQSSSPFPSVPSSPLPFGCNSSQQFGMLSPGMLSPSLLLSPNSQLFGWPPQQLPVSPTVPFSSPR